jgi:hypothetical protein
MKRLSAGILAVALAGCAGRIVHFIQFDAAVAAGQTRPLVELFAFPDREYSIRIHNLGPIALTDEGCALDVLDGDEVLGRLGKGECRTFTVANKPVKLRVRSEGGTEFEASIVGTLR